MQMPDPGRAKAANLDKLDAPADGFLSPSPPRRGAESVFVRVISTAGIVGIGTLVGALLSASNVAGWVVGLVVSILCVITAAVLWRSRVL